MSSKPELLYWDSCVFLSYIDAEVDRVDVIETLFAEVQKSKGAKKIVTSTVSIAEVAYGAQEKKRAALDHSIRERIDALWNDKSVLTFIEFHDGIARIARELMREAISKGHALKPLDAIHLASAQWLQVQEVHTYDDKLEKFAVAIGRKICAPYADQPRLPDL